MSMSSIVFLVPSTSLIELVSSVYNDFPDIREEDFSIMCPTLEEAMNIDFSGQIVIARGYMAYTLQELRRGFTLIEIPMSGYDIIHASNEAFQSFHARKIAFILADFENFESFILDSGSFPNIVGYSFREESEILSCIERAEHDGVDAIICGDRVYSYAKKRHLPAVLIKMGKESIRHAIGEAYRVFDANRENQIRVQRFKTLVENVMQAVVALDEKHCITIYNHDAEILFKQTYNQVIGTHISRICPELFAGKADDFAHVTGDILLTINNTKVVARVSPIVVDGITTSVIITFQSVSEIQRMEFTIRKQIRSKGLVAKAQFQDIMGESPSLLRTIELARYYSLTHSNILLFGETGTGKELFAQSIHNMSGRASGPFVAVNCAALSDSLLESELFGYVDGAFTGATKGGKVGLFEMAHNGTIFLDEIGEISEPLQNRLLRVLEEREIMRLGDDSVIPVNIRIIAATNKDLEILVQGGSFRKDLFYRLDVLRLNIPSLRERGNDILILANHFLAIYDKKNARIKHHFAAECEQILLHNGWDGNIRQLRNICERLSVIVQKEEIDRDDLIVCLGPSEERNPSTSLRMEDVLMRDKIIDLMPSHHTKQALADALGIDRTTLYRKLRKYHLL